MVAPRGNAAIDQNFNPSIFGVSTADGFTPVAVEVDPTTGQLLVTSLGNAASGATDSGNPVKIGGPFLTTQPTVTTGQRVDAQFTNRGELFVSLNGSGAADTDADTKAPANRTSVFNRPLYFNGTTWDRARSVVVGGMALTGVPPAALMGYDGSTLRQINTASNANNADASAGNGMSNTVPSLYNGPTGNSFDRQRNNEEVTLLSSGSRTTTQTSADITNYNGLSALIVVLDMTVVGTGSVTVTVDGKDSISGKYINLLTGAAVVTNVTNKYIVGPHLAAVANVTAQTYLPKIFRIVVTANNANAATYSVGYCLVR